MSVIAIQDYILDKSSIVPHNRFHEVKSHFFLGLAAEAVARNCLRKSRFIDANNLRVGTFRSASFFSFSVGVLTMTLPDVVELFATDDKCRELLERLRWPGGPECPRCQLGNSLVWMRDCSTAKTATTNSPSLLARSSTTPICPCKSGSSPPCCSAKPRKGMCANQ